METLPSLYAISGLIRFQQGVLLYNFIPQALDGGMHDRAIRRLQETQENLKAFIDLASGGNPAVAERFEGLWTSVLRELDDPLGIDPDDVVTSMLKALAPVAGDRFPELETDEIHERLKRLWVEWIRDPSQSVSLRQGAASRKNEREFTRPGPIHRFTPEEREGFARDTGLSDHEPGSHDPPGSPSEELSGRTPIPPGPSPHRPLVPPASQEQDCG